MSHDPLTRLAAAVADRYSIEREIDRGGMAVVYLAEDLRHHRRVAIKVLLPSLAPTIGTDRFLREIEILAKLEHPHILTLIESGVAEGLPYYVMPFVEGQSLRTRIDQEGRLSERDAVRIAREVAEALEYAHQRGFIHRDIKPANILLSDGHAVVADFGIAAALGAAGAGRLTETGISVGSPAYMSPEQASGEHDLDSRTDVYALGCVVYEMLTGEAPFASGSLQKILSRKLAGEIKALRSLRPGVSPGIDSAVAKALSVDPHERFSTAREFSQALRAARRQPSSTGQSGRRRTLVVALAAVVVVAVASLAWVQANRSRSERRAELARLLSEIEAVSHAGSYDSAFTLALQVAQDAPDDTALARLWPLFSHAVTVESDPPGARVYRRPVDAPDDEWSLLGTTPLPEVRLVRQGGYLVRLELEGYRTVDLIQTAVWDEEWNAQVLKPVKLDPVDVLPAGMVRIPGFTVDSIDYADFFMDRYEVTNREFKEFVDAGGYANPELWAHPFVRGGIEISREEAIAQLEDQTGRPGPSTWRLGTYPEGRPDYPVSGVSWYEAAAYARFRGKALPTTRHWARARLHLQQDSWMVYPRSNLGTDGPRPVGEARAMATLGVYDLIGNVREWCYNESAAGRATRGAAWTDAPFHSGWVIEKSPFDRDETHGIRLVRTFDDEAVLARLREPVIRTELRDYETETPASDAEYEIYKRQYAYDPLPLEPIVERADTFELWVREKVTFDLPYGERGGAYLYLPREVPRPLQVMLYWGGAGVLSGTDVDREFLTSFEFLMRSGRAVAQPIFDGAFDRDDDDNSVRWGTLDKSGNAYRDLQFHWIQDLSRTIDYLETRADIDSEKLGYLGFSWGGITAPIALTVDPRIKLAVLRVGGLWTFHRFLPEADPLHFVTRVRQPVLMVNGEYDVVFPLRTAQQPFYRLLGTDPELKIHHVTEGGHIVPLDEFFSVTLDFLDRFMGEPGSTSPTGP